MARFDAVIDALVSALRVIPPGFAWRFGGAVGELFGRLPMRDQRRCRTHLRLAYPLATSAWIERTARKNFRHFGRMALWTMATLHRDPLQLRRGIGVEGAEHLRELVRACRRGKGTVLLTGHFGNWELLSRVGATVAPLSVVGKRLRSPTANRLIQTARIGGGAHVVYQDQDIRSAVRELRAGRALATLPDQDIPRLAGTFVPWFGQLAHTPIGPAALAQFAGGAVQPGFLYARGGRWVVHVGPRKIFPRTADREADLHRIMAWAMAYEEALVRRAPEQWVWWHRRWRTRPQETSRTGPQETNSTRPPGTDAAAATIRA